MAKVDVIVSGKPYRGTPVGESLALKPRDAKILSMLGRVRPAGTDYQTRVMTAQQPAAPAGPTHLYKGIALDDMTVEALRSMAETLGVEFHHNAGPAKIRQAIVDSAK